MSNCSPIFEVACTFLIRGRRIYLSRRANSGLWQNAGGKLNAGETALEACQREVFEETGLLIACDRFRRLGTVEVKGKNYRVHTMAVILRDDEVPLCTEKEKAGPWLLFSVEEACRLETVTGLKYYITDFAAA